MTIHPFLYFDAPEPAAEFVAALLDNPRDAWTIYDPELGDDRSMTDVEYAELCRRAGVTP